MKINVLPPTERNVTLELTETQLQVLEKALDKYTDGVRTNDPAFILWSEIESLMGKAGIYTR